MVWEASENYLEGSRYLTISESGPKAIIDMVFEP